MSTKVYGFDLAGNNSLAVTIGAFLTLAAIIFGGGISNGFYAHIQLTSGYDLSSNETIILTFVNATCKVFNTTPNGQQAASICQEGYSAANSEVNLAGFVFLVLPIVIMILVFTLSIGSLDENSPWLYLVGFILGAIVSVGLNSLGYAVGFAALGGYATIPVTTTTVLTTSTTSTTTSTSSTTTSIPPYTNCLTEPPTENIIPLSCYNPSSVAPNSISFNFTLNKNATTIYNIHLACTVHVQQPPHSLFHSLQSNGMPNMSSNSTGTSLSPGQIIQVEGWPCDTNSTTGAFEGYIWVNYTRYSGPSVPLNPWDSYRTFDVYIKAILTSSAYNQTKNMT